MDAPVASSSRHPAPPTQAAVDAYANVSFEAASQAQILRAHQRDTAQVYRLTELVSEILRSLAGTRWLAHKQTLVDLLVRGVYLTLTFGRGSQTLGEEYTDILPYSTRRRNLPSRRSRFLTILLLLLPTLLVSPASTNYIRPAPVQRLDSGPESRWTRTREKLAKFLESPVGRALPELHMILFLFRGRFFEFARRLTGISYISTLPPRRPEQRQASYEPLGLLMLLPFLYRLLPRRQTEDQSAILSQASHGTLAGDSEESPTLAEPVGAPKTAEQTVLMSSSAEYDKPNTYLTQKAIALPERQCTLCLEPRGTGEGSGGTVAVTECGHIFCWGCLGGLEKLECPLCRQSLRMERLIAAYNL
ncbi:hypothetical protein B9479_005803 [Cryptococcus floricola]|uniref:RING-type E3 ubiquitin transferase n=1 Tax=Cryptococcus floricola TaxID=2591691 RepID=A0A5D3AS36_9TREE|nr:hypothetical protein B9479_005803 [Cryptococcus floricola]